MIAGVKPAHCSFSQTLLSHMRPQGLRVCGGPRYNPKYRHQCDNVVNSSVINP